MIKRQLHEKVKERLFSGKDIVLIGAVMVEGGLYLTPCVGFDDISFDI
jgi:hypothetical protein